MLSPTYKYYRQNNDMSDTDDMDFGNIDSDLEGEVVSRKVQKGGRVNFPDNYLSFIGVESNDRVLITVQDGELTLKPATVDSLAIGAFIKGIRSYMEWDQNAE